MSSASSASSNATAPSRCFATVEGMVVHLDRQFVAVGSHELVGEVGSLQGSDGYLWGTTSAEQKQASQPERGESLTDLQLDQ